MNRSLLAVGVLLSLVAGTARAQNIVVNPGFEAGFAGWTVTPAPNNGWQVTHSGQRSGASAAETGCVGAGCVTGSTNLLFQNLVTAPGGSYDLNFYYNQGPGSPNSLRVWWDGSVVMSLDNIGTVGYQLYTVSGLLASGASTQLGFQGRQDPSFSQLDDISVQATTVPTVTPEPASMALFATGLVGVLGATRRRRSATKAAV